MEAIIAFLVAVTVGGCFATIKEKKNPQIVVEYSLGIRSLSRWTYNCLLPTGIIAYVILVCNIL